MNARLIRNVPRRLARRGVTLILTVVFVAVVLVGLTSLMALTTSSHRTARSYNNKILANNLAEAALSKGVELLARATNPSAVDYYYPGLLQLDADAFRAYIEDELLPAVNGDDGLRQISLRVPDDGAYRLVAVEADPEKPGVLTLRGEGSYSDPTTQRTLHSLIEMDVEYVFDTENYGVAMLSDMPDLGTATGGGRPRALAGNVVLHRTKGTMAVMGEMKANGLVVEKAGAPVTEANIHNDVTTLHPAKMKYGLEGGREEIPDYTDAGAAEQLFDMDRFIAAADAGAGTHFASLDAFVAAANAGQALEGIVVVDVDPGQYVEVKGSKATLRDISLVTNAGGGPAAVGEIEVPGGIDVTGTLLFNIAPSFTHNGTVYPTPSVYRITFETPVHINGAPAAEVDAYLTALAAYEAAAKAGDTSAEPPEAPSGWEGSEISVPHPWEVGLEPLYDNFDPFDDLPALMFNAGVIDLKEDVRISGVVYTPGHTEIENRHARKQFVDGSVIAGGGIYLENLGANGSLVMVYNASVLDRLATVGERLKAPTVIAWRQVQ